MATNDVSSKRIAVNRKALRDFFVLERLEAGIELRGTEVKSIRTGKVSFVGAYAKVERGDLLLFNLNIPVYEFGNRFNHDPARPRRLLLHRKEIIKLMVQTEQKGFTIVPLSLYLKRGILKVGLGVCRGKRQSDKRETLKQKTAERDSQRAVRNARM